MIRSKWQELREMKLKIALRPPHPQKKPPKCHLGRLYVRGKIHRTLSPTLLLIRGSIQIAAAYNQLPRGLVIQGEVAEEGRAARYHRHVGCGRCVERKLVHRAFLGGEGGSAGYAYPRRSYTVVENRCGEWVAVEVLQRAAADDNITAGGGREKTHTEARAVLRDSCNQSCLHGDHGLEGMVHSPCTPCLSVRW